MIQWQSDRVDTSKQVGDKTLSKCSQTRRQRKFGSNKYDLEGVAFDYDVLE